VNDVETPVDAIWAKYVLLALGSLGYFWLMFVWFLLPAFLTPIIATLGLTNTQTGMLTGAIPFVYIPLSLTSGVFVDRFGYRWSLGIALALLGAGQFGRGLVSEFLPMLVLTLLMGAGATGVTFGLPKLVSDLFPPERSGTFSSMYLVTASGGSATAFGLGRTFLEPIFGGWRSVFVTSGIVVVGFGVLWVGASWFAFRFVSLDDADRTSDEAFSLSGVASDVARLVSHRGMHSLIVIAVVYLLLTHSLQGWLPAILEDRGFAPSLAASITSFFIVGRVVGMLTIPPLSDYWRRQRAMVGFSGVLCVVGTVGLFFSRLEVAAVVASVSVVGLGLGSISTLIRSIPMEMRGIGPEFTATAVGLMFTFGEVGGFAGPFLIGVLKDVTGTYNAGITLLFLAALLAVVAAVRMREVTGHSEGIERDP
jgi:cyanate permease